MLFPVLPPPPPPPFPPRNALRSLTILYYFHPLSCQFWGILIFHQKSSGRYDSRGRHTSRLPLMVRVTALLVYTEPPQGHSPFNIGTAAIYLRPLLLKPVPGSRIELHQGPDLGLPDLLGVGEEGKISATHKEPLASFPVPHPAFRYLQYGKVLQATKSWAWDWVRG